MEYKIIDNFLSEQELNNIKEVIFGNSFSWFLKPYVAYESDTKDCYFIHTFYQENTVNSNTIFILQPIIEKLNIKALIRIRANLYTRRSEEHTSELQ